MTLPDPLPPDANAWLHTLMQIAPRMPLQQLRPFASLLNSPTASSDRLLWVADALTETAALAVAASRPVQASEFRGLADLFRDFAPLRADVPIVGPAPAVSPIPAMPDAQTRVVRLRDWIFPRRQQESQM